MDINDYIKLGYTEKQINQIVLANSDGIYDIEKLKPTLEDDIFRTYRKLIIKNHLINENNTELINAINDGIDIYRLYTKVNDNDIENALSILKEGQLFFDKMYGPDMDSDKRKEILSLPNELKQNGLKYKKYPNHEFNLIMTQIKDFGELPFDINTTLYDSEQLEYIFNRFNNNTFHEDILNSNYSVRKMELIDYFLDNNLDIKYIDKYSDLQIDTFGFFIKDDYDISKIYKEICNDELLDIIKTCFLLGKSPDYLIEKYKEIEDKNTFENIAFLYSNNVRKEDYETFINMSNDFINENSIFHIANIIKDLSGKEELNISPLLHLGYSFEQREIIRRGMSEKLDLSKYCTPEFSPKQMATLLDELKQGNVIDNACNPSYTTEQMKQIIFYNTKGIYFDQLEEYGKNYLKDKNEDYNIFLKLYNKYCKNYDTVELFMIEYLVKYNKEHEYQVNIQQVLDNRNIKYDYEEFIEDLNNGLDVNLVWSNKYDSYQRDELRKGFKNGIDISKYSDPSLSKKQMQKIRKNLESKETLDDKINKYRNELATNIQEEIRER